MVAARGEAEPADGLLQQSCTFVIKRTVLFDLARGKARVLFSLAGDHARAGGNDALADNVGSFAAGSARQILRRHRGHFDLDIDAVEQRAGDLAAVAQYLVGRALAAPAAVPEVTAGAGTRCLFAILAREAQVIETKGK